LKGENFLEEQENARGRNHYRKSAYGWRLHSLRKNKNFRRKSLKEICLWMEPSLFEEKQKFQKEIATVNSPMDGTFTPSNIDMNKSLLFPKKRLWILLVALHNPVIIVLINLNYVKKLN
jgi:hypothetical protein